MRAAVYIRVSDEEQVREGYSIDSQNEVCMRWINEKKYDLVDTYIDEGYSAKNMKRPDLKRMMRDIENQKFDILVFWRLNRLTRSVKDKVVLFELIDKYRVGLKSMSEEIDTTTASGRMVTNILISVAQGEREQTSENVHSTMSERALKGVRQGAVAPYGYRLNAGKLIIDPEEAEVVRRIYKLYTKPMSDTAIAKLFNSPPVVPRKSGKWSNNAVFNILTNPVYCGKLRWNHRKAEGKKTNNDIIFDNAHEPIVSVKEFEAIQKERKRRAITHERTNTSYAFTGILRCGRCGHGMIGVKQNRSNGSYTRYYRCLGRSNYGICDMPHIKEETVEEIFLSSLQVDGKLFEKLIEVNEEPEETDHLQKQYEKDLEQVIKRKRKWQEAFANDVISIEDLRQRMEEERVKEEYIKSMMEPIVVKDKSPYSKDEVIEILKSIRHTWKFLNYEDPAKKKFIQEAFESITIDSTMKRGIGGRYMRTPAHIVDWKLNT